MKTRIFEILIIFFVLFSLLPTGYELVNRNKLPANRAFELVHNYYTDYNFYLSRIRQGLEGRLMVQEKYTSEPHVGSLLQIFYLSLGWVGKWVWVPWDRPGDVYQMARLVLGVTFLVLVAQFCRRLTKWSILAFLLAVTASSWPILVKTTDSWRFGGYMSWFSVMDSLQRITFIPHLLAGQTIIVFLLLAVSDEAVQKRPGNWIFLGILALLLGIIFPPGLIFFYVFLAFLAIFKSVNLAPLLTIGLISLPSLIYLYLISTLYPWKRLVEYDVLHPVSFSYFEYVKAVGPLYIFGLSGAVLAIIRREKLMLAAVAWVGTWLFLFGLFRFIPQQSALRFSEVAPQVPLAVLTAYLFYSLRLSRTVPLIIIALGFGTMYSSFLWQRDFIDHKQRASWPLVPFGAYVMYPLQDVISAMKFLGANTARESVVLSLVTAGNYLPVYAGNTVYLGHANTVASEEKEQLAKAFFEGAMLSLQAEDWLQKSRISYVFYGPQEKETGGINDLKTVYPFLKIICQNEQVTIYEII